MKLDVFETWLYEEQAAIALAIEMGFTREEAIEMLKIYHKIGRIPPFLVGGGMNATITIHRQM